MSATIDFYYDFASPNAYFSAFQLPEIATENEASINWKPVLLGAIMNELDTTPPAMQSDAKADYLMKDLEDWSNYTGIPINFPSDFPINSLDALRGALVVEKETPDDLINYIQSVFRAAWVEDEAIWTEESLRTFVPSSISSNEFFEKINNDSIKAELKSRTDKAIDRGVFGSPTFFVDGEMFWGKDRLEFVKNQL